jgi:hypothetical protein
MPWMGMTWIEDTQDRSMTYLYDSLTLDPMTQCLPIHLLMDESL